MARPIRPIGLKWLDLSTPSPKLILYRWPNRPRCWQLGSLLNRNKSKSSWVPCCQHDNANGQTYCVVLLELDLLSNLAGRFWLSRCPLSRKAFLIESWWPSNSYVIQLDRTKNAKRKSKIKQPTFFIVYVRAVSIGFESSFFLCNEICTNGFLQNQVKRKYKPGVRCPCESVRHFFLTSNQKCL